MKTKKRLNNIENQLAILIDFLSSDDKSLKLSKEGVIYIDEKIREMQTRPVQVYDSAKPEIKELIEPQLKMYRARFLYRFTSESPDVVVKDCADINSLKESYARLYRALWYAEEIIWGRGSGGGKSNK